MRKLELLAPAKNLECGLAAIDHGADAVYIGATRFGARAAAGNSVADIAELCRYAHNFDARVYVTVNTLIYDDELDDTRQLLADLAEAHVDAILVQDMAIIEMAREQAESGHPYPFEFHASTQTDNRSTAKTEWLKDIGFSRVVLARELSIEEITAIHREVPDVELEVFVHGALCVSYSGLCYASQHCFGRSANRGECAQFCRMKFDLLDADGHTIMADSYLLSLKDMNQSDNLEALARAGATSFKIEGRLKDVAYVKNVVSAYSQRLNLLVAQHPKEFCRASQGHVNYSFTPDLRKTFNRGYTTYFAPGRQPDIASFHTPKAIGEFVGTVKEIRGRQSFTVAGTASFANGDGLCFFSSKDDSRNISHEARSARPDSELVGFRVNRAEGNRLFPLHMPEGLRPGMRLYRNNDQEFERILARKTAERRIPVVMNLEPADNGFTLSMRVEGSKYEIQGIGNDNGFQATVFQMCEHQQAAKPQRDNIVRQLSRLGDTIYECVNVHLPEDFSYFIPNSILSDLRTRAVAELEKQMQNRKLRDTSSEIRLRAIADLASHKSIFLPRNEYSQAYLHNISNRMSRAFYERHGLAETSPAFELREPRRALIMQCRHCLRYALGYCMKNGGKRPEWKLPLSLRLGDGRTFLLEFDCTHCQMNVMVKD